MLEKRPCGDAGKILVTFRISHRIWADKVALVGDFGGQTQRALTLLQSAADPNWHTTLELDAGRRYRYRYILDGCGWFTDNDADDCITDSTGQEYCVVDTALGRVWLDVVSTPYAVLTQLAGGGVMRKP